MIIDWVDGNGFAEVPIDGDDMNKMPVGSVVAIDDTIWVKEVFSNISGDLCWSDGMPGSHRYLHAASLTLAARSVQLVRWGHYITLEAS